LRISETQCHHLDQTRTPIKEIHMTTTAPATLNPAIIGQAEKHHAAVLSRALAGTTLDEKQWITLNQTLAAGEPVERSAHIARIAALTRWDTADVDTALGALQGSGLLRTVFGDQVEATEEGKAMVGQVRTESGTFIAAAYGAVAPEDLATAARVLATITARIAEELARA
jgi:superfamily II helicase